MKTIWIEDDYLIELALTGKDDLLMEVATCKEKLSYYDFPNALAIGFMIW